jgi:hypothetical protein
MAGELQQTILAIDAASAASTTSAAIPLKGVRKVTIFGTNVTNAHTYGVTVSGDDSTFVTYNKLILNVTTTPDTRAATVAPTSGTTNFATMALAADGDAFSSMKVVGTLVTAGTYTAKVVLEYY